MASAVYLRRQQDHEVDDEEHEEDDSDAEQDDFMNSFGTGTKSWADECDSDDEDDENILVPGV